MTNIQYTPHWKIPAGTLIRPVVVPAEGMHISNAREIDIRNIRAKIKTKFDWYFETLDVMSWAFTDEQLNRLIGVGTLVVKIHHPDLDKLSPDKRWAFIVDSSCAYYQMDAYL